MAIDRRNLKAFQECLRQKKSIEATYDWCKCRIECQNTLLCEGRIQPDENCPSYKIKIRYRFGKVPHVHVVEPEIKRTSATHVYKGGSLCLYFPEEQQWTDDQLIADTIIPWTAEWLLYYELYLISGKWEGPEVGH